MSWACAGRETVAKASTKSASKVKFRASIWRLHATTRLHRYLGMPPGYDKAGADTRTAMPHSGCSLTEPVDLPTMLKSGLGRSPDAPALMSLDETWSWSELD